MERADPCGLCSSNVEPFGVADVDALIRLEPERGKGRGKDPRVRFCDADKRRVDDAGDRRRWANADLTQSLSTEALLHRPVRIAHDCDRRVLGRELGKQLDTAWNLLRPRSIAGSFHSSSKAPRPAASSSPAKPSAER